jgi:hypothetical protein
MPTTESVPGSIVCNGVNWGSVVIRDSGMRLT